MRVSIETTQGLERKMTIAVPGEQVDTAVNNRLQEAARNVRLNGFRQGKVPFKIVKSKFGAKVRLEVVSELMSQAYEQAINEESLKPAGQASIDLKYLNEGEDLEFVATFQVYPEIVLPDFSKIEVERLGAEISESDIDDMIETLRKQRQTWKSTERAAANEDKVNIDFTGRLDGEEFEGGSGKAADLVLGSKNMIPGFEAGIEGKNPGDVFTLALKFPEDYHNGDLAAMQVEFDISLNSVSEQVLPEINEEFYKSFGVEEGGGEAFREEVTNTMQRELKTASRSKLETRLMDSLVAAVEIDIPDALLAVEIKKLRQQALQQFADGQNIDANMLPDDLFKERATRRILLGFVLGEVVQQQGLQADPVRVREAIEGLAASYESPDDVINWYYGNEKELASIESTVLENQVFDHIIAEASVVDRNVSYLELITAEEKSPGEVAET